MKIKSPLKILFVLAALLSTSCETLRFRDTSGEYRSGEDLAHQHLSQGEFNKMDNIGVEGPGTIEMRAALKRKYGIGHIYKPRANSSLVKGYNATMDKALKAKYGNNYWRKTHKELFPEMYEGTMAAFTARQITND